jgi:thymidylate synthase
MSTTKQTGEDENTMDNNYVKKVVFSDYTFHMIVAHSFPEYGIGVKNNLPWSLKNELRHFKNITTRDWVSNDNIFSNENMKGTLKSKNILVFGRKTWDSISEGGKKSILKDRIVVIISNRNNTQENVENGEYWTSWDNLDVLLLELRRELLISNHVFFAGGQSIYEQALEQYPIDCVHITEIYMNKKKQMEMFDSFFPYYKPHMWIVNSHCHMNPDSHHRLCLYECSPFISEIDAATSQTTWYRHKTYCSPIFATDYSESFDNYWDSQETEQYLSIMREIMDKGVDRDDRTGTGTRSVFSSRQVYDLTDTFPMITTRRQWLKGIFEELKLYLSGKTDNKILQNKGIHIWDGNTSRDFLDSRGLVEYPEGDMGETYGFNFRHFAGTYKNCETEYNIGENGYDQLQNVIDLLQTNPTSRRIIINLWNPATLHKAALPSCLMMYQFFVDTVANKLNCQIYIRSSDYFLANNWNCCTGALLVHMLCALKDIPYTPGFISVVTGDTHIYKNHFEQVKENLLREPLPFPKLEINGEKNYNTLDDIDYDDLWLIGYQPQPSISAPMAV